MSESNYFAELAKVNVSAHVEKKGQFSYLSWPFAVQELGKIDPTATWDVRRFDGMPYCKTECGYFVEVAVTCKGVTKSQIHPILNGANKPIASPTAFDVNTSIQRCLVKAIALHGLGLYIYAGEDLPDGEEAKAPTAPINPTTGVWDGMDAAQKAMIQTVVDCIRAELESKGADSAYALLQSETHEWSAEEKVAAWTRFDSKERSAMKKTSQLKKAA